MHFSKCPKCGKKGLYAVKDFVRGFKGRVIPNLYQCRYCHSEIDKRRKKRS